MPFLKYPVALFIRNSIICIPKVANYNVTNNIANEDSRNKHANFSKYSEKGQKFTALKCMHIMWKRVKIFNCILINVRCVLSCF